MNTILDPAILFISENNWLDQTNRDEFLDHLRKNLKSIDKYSLTKIYWNDDMESYLWDSPQKPPWRIDRDWKIQFVPIIYSLLRKNIIDLNFHKDWSSCSVSPLMEKCCIDDINSCFLKLMHEIINTKEDIFLCLSIENMLSNNNYYSFFCTCHSNQLTPELINKPDDWLYHIDLENKCWPNNIEEVEKFVNAIEIVKKRDFNDKPFLFEYKFSKGFIKDIIGINRNKKNILDSIVKRLILTRNEASHDKGLRDHYLAQKKQYRFYVTQENRIHYIFSNKKEIEFLHYYAEGEHDAGL